MVSLRQENYQPQTRDTTAGPQLHTYVPRADGSVMIGGTVFFPQPAPAVAAAAPAPAVVPVATNGTVPVVTTISTAEGAVPAVVQAPAAPPVPNPTFYSPYPVQPPYFPYNASLSAQDLFF